MNALIARLVVFLLLGLAFGGCSGDDVRPPIVLPERSLFWEPASFCLPHSDTNDTLFVSNFGEDAQTWTPSHSPSGATNLDATVTIPAGQTVAILFSWTPPDTGTVSDSLVVHTSDPVVPHVSIPFRRVSAGYVDTEIPPTPALILPVDEDTLRVGTSEVLEWTRVSDCSGIKRYQIQIAADAGFQTVLLSAFVGLTVAQIDIEAGDEGEAWWRVRAEDNAALRSLWSEPRSWIVVSAAANDIRRD
jgi:hypothetical protein